LNSQLQVTKVVEPPVWLQHAFATPGDLEWLQKIIFVE